LNDLTDSFLVLYGNDPSIQDLAQKLASRAHGNPFFIEELVRNPVETGALASQHSAYLPKPI